MCSSFFSSDKALLMKGLPLKFYGSWTYRFPENFILTTKCRGALKTSSQLFTTLLSPDHKIKQTSYLSYIIVLFCVLTILLRDQNYQYLTWRSTRLFSLAGLFSLHRLVLLLVSVCYWWDTQQMNLWTHNCSNRWIEHPFLGVHLLLTQM